MSDKPGHIYKVPAGRIEEIKKEIPAYMRPRVDNLMQVNERIHRCLIRYALEEKTGKVTIEVNFNKGGTGIDRCKVIAEERL